MGLPLPAWETRDINLPTCSPVKWLIQNLLSSQWERTGSTRGCLFPNKPKSRGICFHDSRGAGGALILNLVNKFSLLLNMLFEHMTVGHHLWLDTTWNGKCPVFKELLGDCWVGSGGGSEWQKKPAITQFYKWQERKSKCILLSFFHFSDF